MSGSPCEHCGSTGRHVDGCRYHFVSPGDPEIDALETCLRALLPLDSAARSRVLEYLDDRLKPRETPE